MHEITVNTVSAEEAEHGVAELWAGGEQIAWTRLDGADLVLRFEPRHDGKPIEVSAHNLANALAEVDRLLAIY